MSAPVLHRGLNYPIVDPGRAGIAGTPAPDEAARERRRQLRRQREQRIDEELAESFPASDPPSWVQGDTPMRK